MSETLLGIVIGAVCTAAAGIVVAYLKFRGDQATSKAAQTAADAALSKADGEGDLARASATKLLMDAAGQLVADALERNERWEQELAAMQVRQAQTSVKLDAEIQARQVDQATIRQLQAENKRLDVELGVARQRITELETDLGTTRRDLEIALTFKRDKVDDGQA